MNRIEERLLIEKYCMKCKYCDYYKLDSRLFPSKKDRKESAECLRPEVINLLGKVEEDAKYFSFIYRDDDDVETLPINKCKGKYFKKRRR